MGSSRGLLEELVDREHRLRHHLHGRRRSGGAFDRCGRIVRTPCAGVAHASTRSRIPKTIIAKYCKPCNTKNGEDVTIRRAVVRKHREPAHTLFAKVRRRHPISVAALAPIAKAQIPTIPIVPKMTVTKLVLHRATIIRHYMGKQLRQTKRTHPPAHARTRAIIEKLFQERERRFIQAAASMPTIRTTNSNDTECADHGSFSMCHRSKTTRPETGEHMKYGLSYVYRKRKRVARRRCYVFVTT